jgi:ATP-dependent DNA helicase RecQ
MSTIEALERHFGFTTFRPGQEPVIKALLAGKSAAAVFPTGSGKSLCYQLPALLLPGTTLVVSPLIALMKDQIDALQARGIAARRLDSTLTADEYREVTRQVRAGELKMLYVAPERFQNERFRELVKELRISLFAVDEAHCISEWGHNFRPDYLKLVEFAKQSQAERVLALTATATEKVLSDICEAFAIDADCAVRTGFHRPNLWLTMTPVTSEERDATLLRLLKERPAGPTIVYVTLQQTAEDVAAMLRAAGLPAKEYHAGLESEVRATIQDRFLASDRGIVVATIAFGMGVDKSNIRYVYHYNLPKSLENYAQEIGRAGRDGEIARCEMLVCLEDREPLEAFATDDTPTLESLQQFVREIFQQREHFDVSYYDLSKRHDIRQLVVRTLLTYLELDGYLQAGTPFYAAYKFKPLASSQAILARFEGERREFLANLLKRATKAKTWFHIKVDEAAKALGAPRDRVVRALSYLEEQGLIELEATGTRNQYQRLKAPASLEDLAQSLHVRTLRREEQEIARLGQVIALATSDACPTANLCRHFGEELPGPCGHCSWCQERE